MWPVGTPPDIHHGGRYSVEPNQWAAPFVMRFMAIHLHEVSGKMTLGRRKLTLAPGDVTILPPGIPITHCLSKTGQHLCIHFYAPRIKGECVGLPIHLRLGPVAPLVHEKLTHIITMLRLVGQSDAGRLAARVASTALHELLLWLALQDRERNTRSPNWRAQNRIEALAQRIDDGLGGVLSVPQLASEVGLSQDYLARLFRQYYGVTIPGYILRRRIDTARHLLLTTRDSIGTVAARVGLPNPQYFNKQFRRFVGISPTHFRQ
jgi:AraC-like DNA-binding protein